ncbi:MAG: lysophospholipid acyltransferase family protein [Bacteroidales bacterium]|nr:lysophospholipid acyltransferase family protein [Bacteroidales bacterium]
MNKIAFTILRGILWFLALMPFWLLYLLSDFLFVVIYYVVRYRRQVTIENLRNSFPEKTEYERQQIARKYYRNLADIVLEFIKIEHITRKTVDKRMIIKNPEILTQLYQSGKSIFITIGHCGNWEWLGKKIALSTKHNAYAVIKPIHDPLFNNYMTQLRVRFHSPNLIDYKKTFRVLSRVNDTLNAVLIASDQTPTRGESNFWATFLHQDTAFFLGVEKISKALDYAVLFFDIQRIKRGYYEITIHTISLEPKETAVEEITRKYITLLENAVRQNPDNWLWSHRRWKHKKSIDFS